MTEPPTLRHTMPKNRHSAWLCTLHDHRAASVACRVAVQLPWHMCSWVAHVQLTAGATYVQLKGH